MNNNFNRIILAISLLITLFLSFFVFNWSDDFALILDIKNSSVFQHMISYYLVGDGRFLSIVALFQSILLLLPSQFSAFIWIIFFYLSAYFLLKIILLELKLNISNKKDYFFLLGLFLLLFYFSNFLNISDTAYWVVGGCYSLARFIIILWIYIILQTSTPKKNLVLFSICLFSVLTGQVGVNSSASLLMFYMIFIYSNNSLSILKKIIIGISFLTGTLITVFGPGNFVRATIDTTSFKFSFSSTIYSMFEITFRYFYYSLVLIVLSILFSYLLFLFYHKKSIRLKSFFKQFQKYFFKISCVKIFFSVYKWLIIALASIAPIIAVPAFSGRRTAIFFMMFLIIFIVTSLFNVFKLCEHKNSHKTLSVTIVSILLIISLGILIRSIILSIPIHRQMIERITFMKNEIGKTDTLMIKPIIVNTIPFTYKFHDYISPSYIVYYKYKEILLDTAYCNYKMPYYYLTPP